MSDPDGIRIERDTRRPTRPFKPDPSDVERVAAWAETAADPFEEIGSKVRTFATSYPLDWIEAAVLCGITGGVRGKVWSYAHKCLLAWWDKGTPDHAEVSTAIAATPSPHAPGRNGRPVRDTLSPSQRRREDWKAELEAVKAEKLAARPKEAPNGDR